MAESASKYAAPIEIPLAVRWRQTRRRFLPALSFLVCVGFAGWLWTRQSTVTHGWGEVYSPLVELNSPIAGEFKPAPQVAPRLYDYVKKGQQLASIESDGQISLVIAPVTGHLTELHVQPGQVVPVGAKLFRITPDEGDYIVGFVNRRANQEPRQKTPVIVRTRGRDPLEFRTTIEEVGPLGNAPKVKGNPAPLADSAIPVRVGIPHGVHLRPGQLVELQFPSPEEAQSSRAAEMAMDMGEDQNF